MSEKRKYRQFTPEQKAEIVLAGVARGPAVRDVCREYEISETLYYHGGTGCSRAARPPWPPRTPGLRSTSRSSKLEEEGRQPWNAAWGARPTSWRSRGNSRGTGRERPCVQGPRRGRHRARPAVVGARGRGRPVRRSTDRSRRRPPGAGPGQVVDRVTTRSSRSPRRTRPTGPGWSPRWRHGNSAKPVNRKRAQRMMRAHGLLQRYPEHRPAPPAGLLPGPSPGRALAHGHDQGLDRRARLGLPARMRRLLHPRGRRLDASTSAPAPRRRSPASRPPSSPAASHPDVLVLGHRQRSPSSPRGTSASTSPPAASPTAAAATATPSPRHSSSPGSASSRSAAPGDRVGNHRSKPAARSPPTSTPTTTGPTPGWPTAPPPRSPAPGATRTPTNQAT